MAQERIKILLDLLADKHTCEGVRQDALWCLADYDDSRVLEFLTVKALDVQESSFIRGCCAEAIGIIWARNNYFDAAYFELLDDGCKIELKGSYNPDKS